MNPEHCLCGSQEIYAACCRPYLSNDVNAPTPEALMRSRYTAFRKGNIDYLILTHHPSKRSPNDRKQLTQTIQNTDWLALRVLETAMDPNSRERGFVEFVAFYHERHSSYESTFAFDVPTIERESPGQLHEKSEFIREQGRWFYLQGVSLGPIKLSRSGPCWCGSGKKFKQCHGKRS